MRAHLLRPGDGSLQCLHGPGRGSLAQEHEDETRRIAPGHIGKRVARDDAGPLGRGAHVPVGLQPHALRHFGFEQALQRRGRPGGAPEHHVAALEQRPHVREPEALEQRAQVGHRDPVVAADIDAADEADEGHRGGHQW